MKNLVFNSATVLMFFLALEGCSLSFSGLEFRRGENAAAKQNYITAIKHFKNVMERDPETEVATAAAREAARISYFETKNFDEAIKFFEHLVRYSEKEDERRNAQEKIASILFEKQNNYQRAIQEYNKLLLLRNSADVAAGFHFNISKAQFYLNNFLEAQTEVESALKTVANEDQKFEFYMFLGNIYFNTKRAEQAVKIYEELMLKYPERAAADKVVMNIIVCYEEMEAFEKAIDRLEKMRSGYGDQEFIDLKIKRLRERKANLPGSKGLRK